MKFFIFLLIFLSASLIASEPPNEALIVWNVGQGQWATRVYPESCWHFDMGGEFFPWNSIEKQCAKKRNFVFLSHWDWDHIGGLTKAARHLPNICLARGPLGSTSARKARLLPKTPCPQVRLQWEWQTSNPIRDTNEGSISNRSNTSKKNLQRQALASTPTANALSQVFMSDSFLIPGDSTTAQEKQWASRLQGPPVHFLLLGHHGSKTSSSSFLLRHLPELRQAIATARWRRYHHPHPETLARLKLLRIPVLRTEDWGSLHFEL